MVEDSGEAQPADAAPPSAPMAPTPPTEPKAPAEPASAAQVTEPLVGEPPPFTGEGDRRQAVEGGAPATIVEPIPKPEAAAPAALDKPLPEPVPPDEPVAEPSVIDPRPPAGDRHEAVEGAPIVPVAEAVAEPTPLPTPRAPRTIPPMLQFAAWRLLELATTVVVAALLIGLLIRGDTPADTVLVLDRLAITVPLVVLSLLIGLLVGLPIGYLSARAGSWTDVALRALTTLGLAFNPVWLAMLLVLVFGITLQWLQPGGFIPWSNPAGALLSLVLPALAIGLPLAAEIASRLRDALTAILAGPMMQTADILGYSRADAIRDFALRQALAGTFGRLAVPLALLVPMCLVIEAVFYLPGLGRMIFTALAERDFPALQLGLVTLVALVALCRFLGRLLEARFDPRLPRRA